MSDQLPYAVLFTDGRTPRGEPQAVFIAPFSANFGEEIKELHPFFSTVKKAWLFPEENLGKFRRIAADYYDIQDFSAGTSLLDKIGDKNAKILFVSEDAPTVVVDAAYIALTDSIKGTPDQAKKKRAFDRAYDNLKR